MTTPPFAPANQTPATLSPTDRQAMRQRLGVGPLDVFLAPPNANAPAWPLAMACILAKETADFPETTRWVLAVSPDQHGLGDALDHLANIGQTDLLLQTPSVNDHFELWPLLDAIVGLDDTAHPKHDPRFPREIAPPTPFALAQVRPMWVSPHPDAEHPIASEQPRDLAKTLADVMAQAMAEKQNHPTG